MIIVVSVVVEGEHVTNALKGDPSKRFSIIGSQVFEAIGVIRYSYEQAMRAFLADGPRSFAFVCHHNSLLIYGSLHTPTLDRFSAVTHVSTALSLVFCLLLGLAGFLVFTDKTQGNILNNFSPVSNAVTVS